MQVVTKKTGETIQIDNRVAITIVDISPGAVQMEVVNLADTPPRQVDAPQGRPAIDSRSDAVPLVVFLALTIGLAIWGAPLAVAGAFVFALAAYSTLMGLARRNALLASPPGWARVLNFIRECLANEPIDEVGNAA
jgi:hypothetical protein